jgi:cation diffusion facilitator CzcD-associated flavoprotein CzcO
MTQAREASPALRVAIIGAGFSGLCAGIQLKKAGIESFAILEKAERLGGTWRDNTYPGAACDVPSISYCFSFEQKTDWSRKWAPHDEILGYMDYCADKYGLRPHLRLNTEIAGADFDEGAGLWRLRTVAGGSIRAQFLICGTGQLNRPFIPDLPGAADFAGEAFHSAGWRHDCDLRNKSVAVIGNAASAIQLIPQIAEQAAQVHVFQRTPNWMIPRGDRAFTDVERELFRRLPWLVRLYRWWNWARLELLFYPLMRRNRTIARHTKRVALENMRALIADPDLQKQLIPTYPPGAKRVLISDDYYQALARPNVHLVTSPIERIAPGAVVTRDGRSHAADVLIYATGFQTTQFLAPMCIAGLGGQVLEEAWREGARAYLGMSVTGFPNLFLMYGPNTNLGHNSIIFMIECQARYIVGCIEQALGLGLKFIDVRPEVMAAYNTAIQRKLAGSVWAQVDHSWYKNEAGLITNNWSGSTLEYWWRTRRADLGVYCQEAGSTQSAHAATTA